MDDKRDEDAAPAPAAEAGDEVDGPTSHDWPLLTPPTYVCSSTGSIELRTGVRERNPTTVVEFESMFRKAEPNVTFRETVKQAASKKWSKCSAKRMLSRNFPTIYGLRNYKLREYLPNDIVAGLTAGITMIPQCMAFASLSTLPPIVGLYISFFACLTYFVLGGSHQLSWGCVAVLSILMGNVLDNYETKVRAELGIVNTVADSSTSTLNPLMMNVSDITVVTVGAGILNTTAQQTDILTSDDELPYVLSVEKKIEVASAVSVVAGIILAVLGKLGLGRVTSFMSDSLITSFAVGVSFHVLSSQVKAGLGLDVPRQHGIFRLVRLWVLMLSNIHHTNLATAIITVICVAILYVVKRFVNERYKARLRVPVPIELFVVIIATLITAYTGLSEKFSVKIVKEIPVGVPQPRLPDLSLGMDYLSDGLVIIIVAFTQHVAMAKLMGLKHNYRTDANQEMFACGIISVVCGIFSGYSSGPSISRSMVQDGAGGKTQVASLFAAALVLLVILVIGPYFYFLPKCVLSAIIIVNLIPMFRKLTTIPVLWRESRVDSLVWITTCSATVFLDTGIGLIVGAAASIIFILLRSQFGTVDVVSEICAGDIRVWRPVDKYKGGKVVDGLKVLRINSALYFANAEIMKDQVYKKTGVNPIKRKKEMVIIANVNNADGDKAKVSNEKPGKERPLIEKVTGENDLPADHSTVTFSIETKPGVSDAHSSTDSVPFSHLIIDLSAVPFLDIMGVQALRFLITKYEAVGISVYLADAQKKCLATLQSAGFLQKHGDLVFVTLDGAVQHVSALLKV